MVLVILILALEITDPHTHQPDLLFELNSFKAGECRFSDLFFGIGIIRDRHRPRECLKIAESDLYRDCSCLISMFLHVCMNIPCQVRECPRYNSQSHRKPLLFFPFPGSHIGWAPDRTTSRSPSFQSEATPGSPKGRRPKRGASSGSRERQRTGGNPPPSLLLPEAARRLPLEGDITPSAPRGISHPMNGLSVNALEKITSVTPAKTKVWNIFKKH